MGRRMVYRWVTDESHKGHILLHMDQINRGMGYKWIIDESKMSHNRVTCEPFFKIVSKLFIF